MKIKIQLKFEKTSEFSADMKIWIEKIRCLNYFLALFHAFNGQIM